MSNSILPTALALVNISKPPPANVVGTTILTANGWYFDYLSPGRGRIDVETIAHALSHICRFTGHCLEFYSVAEHCVRMSYIVPPQHALWALGHEAGEPMVGDMNKPLKMMLPEYSAIESPVERHILREVFGLDPDARPDTIKPADFVMLATEQRDLMPKLRAIHWDEWGIADAWQPIPAEQLHWTITAGVRPLERIIKPWNPKRAKREFLKRYRELMFGAGGEQEGTLIWSANKATRILAKPETTENLLLPKPVELMARTGWIERAVPTYPYDDASNDPARPGPYEVQWDRDDDPVLWTWFVGVSSATPCGWLCGQSNPPASIDEALKQRAACYRPLRWRGITEAEARNLGVVK